MGSDSISLIIIVACIVMSAYFSATETAVSSLNRIRVKNLAEKGNKKAKLVMKLSENYDSLLSTILIGNNIVNIASASLATVLFVNMLGAEAGPSVSTAVTTVVVLIFGEICNVFSSDFKYAGQDSDSVQFSLWTVEKVIVPAF